MEHTATPWKVDRTYPEVRAGITVAGEMLCIKEDKPIPEERKMIGLFGSPNKKEAQANAAFIVKAANAHEALVSLLRECDEYLESVNKINSIGTGSILHLKMKAALKLAE